MGMYFSQFSGWTSKINVPTWMKASSRLQTPFLYPHMAEEARELSVTYDENTGPIH